MSGTMTWVGFDVHARSTYGAAIDTMTGELTRMRFGPGIDGPVAWLGELPGPVRACYEAGPTGFGLYRTAVAAGIGMQVIAPGKTPRGPSDRVKTDRKDAELLARLLLAGSLTRVVVPPPEVEAAREMTRAHDACRESRCESPPRAYTFRVDPCKGALATERLNITLAPEQGAKLTRLAERMHVQPGTLAPPVRACIFTTSVGSSPDMSVGLSSGRG
jgi:transposase